MNNRFFKRPMWLLGLPLIVTACGGLGPQQSADLHSGLNPELVSKAITTATDMRLAGRRVWCVPFARNASGIEIRGNAETWWDKAKGIYWRGHTPRVGAVMAFAGTRKLPMGHVAVVSEIVDERMIKIHHANWHRNRVSLDMAVQDVSEKNDWSRVRVETNPGSFGSVYVIDGFIADIDDDA